MGKCYIYKSKNLFLSDDHKSRREELKGEVGFLVLKEEVSWRQKSRVLWLWDDFHRLANAHRRANHIGEIVSNGHQFRDIVEVQ